MWDPAWSDRSFLEKDPFVKARAHLLRPGGLLANKCYKKFQDSRAAYYYRHIIGNKNSPQHSDRADMELYTATSAPKIQ